MFGCCDDLVSLTIAAGSCPLFVMKLKNYFIADIQMKIKNPLLFLGSSTEAREQGIPQAFGTAVENAARVVPWWDAPQFSAMETTIDALYQAANEYDFAIFVLTPDGNRSRGAVTEFV